MAFRTLVNDRRFPFFILAIACAVVYANSLVNGFVWDDRALVNDNRFIREWRFLPKVFTTNLFGGAGHEAIFYRPVQTLTFMIDYRLWGLRPFGYHLTNLLLHLGCTILVYMFVARVAAWRTAMIAGLLFAVHPLQTEAVAYVSGRADSLAVGFGLLSLLLYINAQAAPRDVPWRVGSLAAFAVALLSKEMAMVFPALLILYDLLFDQPRSRSDLLARLRRRYLPYLGVLALYGLVRHLSVGLRGFSSEVSRTSLFERGLLVLKVFGEYLLLLVAPRNLHMERTVTIPSSLFEWPILGAAALLMLLAGLGAWAFRRNRSITFGLLWFFIAFLPISNLIPLNAEMAEHWMYLPAIGLFLTVALGVETLERQGRGWLVTAPLVAVILLFGGLSIRRNLDWKDEVTFYELTLKASPESSRMYENLGLALMERNQYERAIEAFKTAIRLAPGAYKHYLGLGSVYRKMGRLEEAIEQYRIALVFRPGSGLLHLALGQIYMQMGQEEKAITEFEQASDFLPPSIVADITLGERLFKAGQDLQAIGAYQRALAGIPLNVEVRNKLGLAYARSGQVEQAVKEFQEALRIDPTSWLSRNHLGIAFLRMKRYSEAAQQFEHAVTLVPSYAEAQNNLGIAYTRLGRFKEAEAAFRRALEFRPGSEEIKKNLAQLASAPRPQPALEELERTVRADPRSAKAHYDLGTAYGNEGRLDKAAVEFQEALRFDPRNPLIHYAIGLVAYNKGDREAARRAWGRSLQIDSNFALAREGLARLGMTGPVAERAR
jgi:tetratricopeptide (TPR) repeat protein